MNSNLLPSRPVSAATKIALLYLALSLLWITCSDRLILFLFSDADLLTHAQTSKGYFFVTTTAILLFYLLKREINRHQQTNLALRASENYLSSIFRAAPTGIGVTCNRILLDVNDRICAMTGYDREELIDHDARILYPSQEEYERVGAEKYRQITAQGTGTVETRWMCKDRRIIDVLLSSTPMDPDNLAAGVTFTALDITEAKRAETVLRNSEERYRGLVDLAVDGILLGSPEGVVTEANQQFCAMTGLERNQLIGKHISELPFSSDSLTATPFRFDLLQLGKIVISERTMLRADGSHVFIEMRSKMMPDGSYQSIFRDVTERKQTEEALRESEEKFAHAFSGSPDSLAISRVADGVIVEVNQGFCDLSGFSREEALGKPSLDLGIWHDPVDRLRMYEAIERHGRCDSLEVVFRRKDGALWIGLLSARPILIKDEPHLISITYDITRRKQDEADLERLKVAIEHAAEVIVVTDADGNILYANPSFERVTGYTVKEAICKNPRILQSGEHDEAFYKDLWTTITSGRVWKGRLINRSKQGVRYVEEATISPVFNAQGTIVNYVAIKRDITAHLILEEQYLQAQRMESVGRLTGGVAHDFNNFLGVILGYSEMAMQHTDPSQPMHAFLEKITEAATRSTDIVRQLLAFSRKQAIEPRDLDLNQTVAGLLKMLRRLIGEDIALTWIPSDHPLPVLMDPTQVDQILANLCVNARDAIDGNGAITLETDLVEFDETYCGSHAGFLPGVYVVLAVSDNGCGIPQDILDKIFEPFFTTKGALGTGLGLATVYGIVRQNNGFINVYSEPGLGATFKIYLPMHASTDSPKQEPLAVKQQQGRGETILLVEDSPEILEMSQAMLENLGYTVLPANSPVEALQRAAGHPGPIDLMLTDVIMPEMNGKELSRRIHELHPTLQVMYMSGYTANVIAHHGVLDEGIHFLQKPFSIQSLSLKVKEALDARQQTTEHTVS